MSEFTEQLRVPSRRRILSGVAYGTLGFAGCLGESVPVEEPSTTPKSTSASIEATSVDEQTTTPTDASTRSPAGPPGDIAPVTQFQYNPHHTGVVDSDIPTQPTQRWRTRLDPSISGLAVTADRVLALTNGSLVALERDDGKQLWSTEVGLDARGAPAVTSDTAYVTTWNGGPHADRGVVAVDLSAGRERWRSIPDVDVGSAPTLADGTLYVGGSLNSTEVVALNAVDGSERWRATIGQYASTPTVDGTTVYVGGGKEPVVVALATEDGTEQWRTELDDRVWGAPTLVSGMLYVGTRAGSVYALDATDGSEVWHVPGVRLYSYYEGKPEKDADVRESLAVTAEAIYVPGRESVHALTLDGSDQWTVEVRGQVYAPTVAGDAFVATSDTDVWCLDSITGAERWRHGVATRQIDDMSFSGIQCEPVVHDGVVYVGSSAGDVYAFEEES